MRWANLHSHPDPESFVDISKYFWDFHRKRNKNASSVAEKGPVVIQSVVFTELGDKDCNDLTSEDARCLFKNLKRTEN